MIKIKSLEEIEELKRDAYIKMKPIADMSGVTEEELNAWIEVTTIKMVENEEI